MGRYRKSITALVTAVVSFASAVVVSEPTQITSSEWLMLGTGLAGAFGVYQFANTS